MKKQNTKADLYAEIAILKNTAKSALELLTRIQRDAPDSAARADAEHPGAKYPHLAGAYEYGVKAAIASLQRMVDR